MDAVTINAFIQENCPGLSMATRDKFAHWLKGMVDGAPKSSNVPSHNLPFQRWYRFKEAFSPLLVSFAKPKSVTIGR